MLRALVLKVFLKLDMCVYLRTKFQVFNIILTRFRQGLILPPPLHLTSNQTLKKLTQIRVKLPPPFILRPWILGGFSLEYYK